MKVYKTITRPIRTLMIWLLFKLLRVDAYTQNMYLFEDLPKLAESEKAIAQTNLAKYNQTKALATAYANVKYREVLYYEILSMQRKNVTTLDPDKRDVQAGALLFILKHLDDMKKAWEGLRKSGRLNNDKALRKILRSFHSDNSG